MKNMKKTLVSLFIIAAMMMSMIVVVSASSDYTTILKAYNGISADVGTMNGKWKVVQEENGNKYISTTGGIGDMLNTPANTGKGGIIKASFDFKFTLTAGRGYVSLYNSGQQHNKANMLTLLYKDEGTMRTAGNKMFIPTLHEWYTEEAIIDLTNKKVDITIYDKSTGEEVATLDKQLELSSAEHTGWSNAGEDSFEYFLFAANSDNGNGVVDLDNFKVERYCTTELKALTDLQDVETGTMNGAWKVVEESNGNKYYSTTGGYNDMLNAPANTGAGGKVKASFDFKFTLEAGRGYVSLYNSGQQHNKANMLTLLYKDSGTMRCAGNGMFVPTLHEWYTEEAVIDLDNKNISVVIYNKATGETVATLNKQLELSGSEHTGWSNAGENSFEYFLFAANSDAGKGVVDIDNLKVEKYEELTDIPVDTTPVEKILYSNNVEDGKVLHAGGTTVVTDPADSSNNCAKYNGGWYGAGLDLSEKVKSGIVQVKFDYMTNATGSSFHLNLAGSERSGKNLLTLIRRNGTIMEGAAGRYGTFETGKWYTVDTIINFDTKHYVTYIKDKATGAVINSKDVTLEATTAEYSGWPAEINEFTMLFFSGGSADEYLDNVFVTTLLEEPAPLPTEKTLYSNDVEDGKVLHAGGTTVVTDPADGSNNCAKYNGGWYGAGLDLSEKVKSGIVQVKFDYMTNATGSSFHLNLAGSERSGKNLLTLVRRNGDVLEGAAGRYGTVETGKWYTVDTVINFDTKHYMSVVKDKATGKVLKSVDTTLEVTTAEYSGWPAEINEFTMLFFSGGSADEYLDNVLVKTLLEEPEMEQEEVDPRLLYSNDFQSGSAPANGTINSESDGNKYLTLNGGWKNIQYKFDEVTTDKIKVTFDFMNTESGSSFYAALLDSSVSNSDGTEFLTLIRDEKKMECYSSTQNRNILGDHVDNEWLTYEAVIDMNTKKCISTVYNKATAEAIATVEVTLAPSDANLADWPKTATAFDTFMIVSGRANGTHFDNILIEKVVEAPVVSADSVTIKEATGEVQSVWTKVSPSAKVFEIGFGTSLDEATVTKDSIYVTKKGSTTPLAGNVAYADGKAVLTLTDDLEINTVYVLNITADIANILGETLADSVAYEFKTDSGKVSAVMGEATVNGNAVAGFAKLTAGDLIKVPVTYINTTGEAKKLYFVVAYYKNSFKELADVEFISTPFDGTITNGEYEFEHTFKTVDGADSMRFMMWDGFDTLIPLSSSVSVR